MEAEWTVGCSSEQNWYRTCCPLTAESTLSFSNIHCSPGRTTATQRLNFQPYIFVFLCLFPKFAARMRSGGCISSLIRNCIVQFYSSDSNLGRSNSSFSGSFSPSSWSKHTLEECHNGLTVQILFPEVRVQKKTQHLQRRMEPSRNSPWLR